MATIVLSAVGSAVGGTLGGSVFGLSTAVLGRAVGATLGRAIDQRLLGSGSDVVESGRLERLRVMGSSEGGAVPRLWGRMRLSGNVIWASNFLETVTTTNHGGKGAPKGPETRTYSYSVSLAIALCEGEISRVGRIWADGELIPRNDMNFRVYTGSETQLPDPLIDAIEGPECAPAYRGTAYVVIEDLDLARFGNRVPQFSFEVIRMAASQGGPTNAAETVKAVSLMPGTGEFALSTTPIYRKDGIGATVPVNINTPEGVSDLTVSLDSLTEEVPSVEAVSLVVSWFGNDLRAGQCQVEPKVEHAETTVLPVGSQPVLGAIDPGIWSVGGVGRANAGVVSNIDDRPVYGGTPSDSSVIEAIAAINASGKSVMFYPFLLMELLEGNGLPDPYGGTEQAAFPWRGRITTDLAPGQPGSTDGTAQAGVDVAAFMGTANPSDFLVSGQSVNYTGPAENSFRRFILHYAHLCAAAGGVESFCIGSEMRGLTQIRDETGGFPAVAALAQLAADVRSILGPATKIGYAADWSEYFGYHPQDGSGDVYFHLDPLWASPDIDFVGIDNYFPISDWRDGDTHTDAGFGTLYNLEYLQANIAGGEGFDWYYASEADRDAQIRSPITDGAFGEPWVYRFKDIKSWWGSEHHERIGGVRSSTPTAWVPGSKPIWFTELGCAAVDKGPNQPNKFLDPKSSESSLPYYSNGRRDDYVQAQFLRAYDAHFADVVHNPVSAVYGAPMVDMSRTFIWAWDARPWPDFPNARDVWSDGKNFAKGHWITGRVSNQSLASVVAELCERAGVTDYDVDQLHGLVRGYVLNDIDTTRAALQPLLLAQGADAVDDAGVLRFANRELARDASVEAEEYLASDGDNPRIETTRAPEAEVVGRVLLSFVDANGEFGDQTVEARFPDDKINDATRNEMNLALLPSEALSIAERWLSEARVARDTVSFGVPKSRIDLKAGEVVALETPQGDRDRYRIDRIEDLEGRRIEATRMERQIYTPRDIEDETFSTYARQSIVPLNAQFMDLPLLRADQVPHAPFVAVTSDRWSGAAAVYDAAQDDGYALNDLLEVPATLGVTQSTLPWAYAGVWQRGARLQVELVRGELSSADQLAVLNGANTAVVGDGSAGNWEVFQFENAELIGPNNYELSGFLRGQAGSDGIVPDVWPVGSQFILLNTAPRQLNYDISLRGLARHFRVGPAARPLGDSTYQYYIESFEGVGLRPFAPVHLRAREVAGELEVSWIRRTRIDGDSWNSIEVPLGEETELYRVEIRQGGQVVRGETTAAPNWTYNAAMQGADGLTGGYEIAVAQISNQFGAGLFSRILIDG